ncbi:MYG1 family protein [Clostridium polynesiense]|uniref:MYG1 family protein n=1 Tax=Clostridium polynesiense TaxID=1325933 RepID=UPI0009E4F5A3|nr:MYG1 family protein [Clostridium polynesiense]
MNYNREHKKVGTHDGRFHADDVMATAILKEIFNIEITRTREESTLEKLDIVYDVGGGKFDHHGMDKIYREDGVPYAACGLIWKEFGERVISTADPSLNVEDVDYLSRYIDRALIEGIDALDNGVNIGETSVPILNISNILSGFNPPWFSKENEDEAFLKAVGLASQVLKNKIRYKLSSVKARESVEKAFNNRYIPQVMVLDKYIPYGEVLQRLDKKQEVLYVIYKDKNNYAAQTVRDSQGEDRKKFPEAWASKRDGELAEVTGVKDAVFCHSGRFIAIAGSFEGIKKMVEIAIGTQEEKSSGALSKFFQKFFTNYKNNINK